MHAINMEIHNFSDASSYAYGACTYMQITGVNGNRFCSVLIGKARLAPIKSVSIPRLELIAAVLAVRLNNAVKCALEAKSCLSYFWTDSMAVLHSIRSKAKRFPPFVANRLAIIEQSTEIAHWRYVPSDINPADIASRAISADDTFKLQTWLEGPLFLTEETYTPFSKESSLLEGYEPPSDFRPVRNLQVLLVEYMQQPSKWVLGRVLEICPGRNGLVRTVLVKSQSNIVKRPITKLGPIITNDIDVSKF